VKQAKQLLRTLFNRKWWWVTIIVFALMLVLARLGIWQLDRLEQRRARNRLTAAALAASPMELGQAPLPVDLSTTKDRQVIATGAYDFDNQLILKVQNWDGRAGVNLITPLLLEDGEKAVLVDRGWIPDAENNPAGHAKYHIDGQVTVEGFGALSQALIGRETSIPEEPQVEWYRVDIAAIQPQMPYDLLPIYIRQAPGNIQELPFRQELEVDLSEGSHLGYALQWFTFSLGLGIAYVIFVRKNSQEGGPE
jgi:surfeit locus 1 family protein